MWMKPSWTFLLTLAAGKLIFVSDAGHVAMSCCFITGNALIKEPIKNCFEQKQQRRCKIHAYLITTHENRTFCVKPDTKWLKEKIKKGTLKCSPLISKYSYQ